MCVHVSGQNFRDLIKKNHLNVLVVLQKAEIWMVNPIKLWELSNQSDNRYIV